MVLGNSPYILVYENEAILPPNVYLTTIQLFQSSRGTPSSMLQLRINNLVRLEEESEIYSLKF